MCSGLKVKWYNKLARSESLTSIRDRTLYRRHLLDTLSPFSYQRFVEQQRI